jgi:hypothetical protein
MCTISGTPAPRSSFRAGVPVKVVSQRIGHASPAITMAVYQHVLPGDDEEAALVGAQAIFGAMSAPVGSQQAAG